MMEPTRPNQPDPTSDMKNDPGRLIRSNEFLRQEAQRLYRQTAELAASLRAAMVGSEAEREVRRAALNLLEDAESARRAEQREMEERRRVEEELRDANRRKDEFLATLAHELRNPLAPIRNSLHLLRMAGADSGSVERIHEMMERQVNHLVRLVDDLMDVSRITRGVIDLRTERVEIAAVIRNAVESCKSVMDDNRHRLAISIPAEPLILQGDAVRLTQVLINLLNNAAKYTDANGQIRLAAMRLGDEVLISVRDNGRGIPGDMLPRVFDMFTQVDRAYERTQGGLGIGLTLVRKLVEMHGGSVEARSEGRGRGSEFVVRLPLAAGSIDKVKPTQANGHSAEVAPHRILVVDDNRDAAETLTILLERMGHEVRRVYDGKSALESMRIWRPSVVFLDIGMPGMDGNEVARRARQQFPDEDTTLVALTGWGQDDDRRRSKEAGFDHHLVKPVELDDLKSLLADIRPNTWVDANE